MLLRTWSRKSPIPGQFIYNTLQQKIILNAVEPTRRSVTVTTYHTATSLLPVSTIPRRLYTTGSAPSISPQFSDNDSTSAETNENDPETSEKLRRVLRKVPFPVVVVSTSSPHNPSHRRGITISSFSSISLRPIPLISFCVKLPSRASTILHESDQFVVQFLASDQIPHSVAFSSSVPPPPTVAAALSGSRSGPGSVSTPLSSGPRASKSGVPQDKYIEELVSEASRQTLVESESNNGSSDGNGPLSDLTTETDPDPFEVLGYTTDPESNIPVLLNTLGAIRCRTHKVMEVGDHEMWIGHVEKVLHGEIPDQQEPLLYHDRSYRRVGRRIL
ncbi:hypothetical protein BGX21_000689 [Mortierella sp. AD011]|nr:hypothetical protein BGX20_003769 [Mortierella sp. AD010]KAF9386905.1 hypothetical protein BGX21_000689 [Mortierella sp. AD011]